jgi:hypothetical protein
LIEPALGLIKFVLWLIEPALGLIEFALWLAEGQARDAERQVKKDALAAQRKKNRAKA